VQERIHKSLNTLFQRQRLVFWYDPSGEWLSAFESFAAPDIHKLRVQNNEFGIKVAIHRNKQREARYLLYFASARPPDKDNWLLDLLLQGHEYKADRASLIVQEVGVAYQFHPVVEAHLPFFAVGKQLEALKKWVDNNDDERSLQLKMLAVLSGTEPDIDEVLLKLFSQSAPAEGSERDDASSDLVVHQFGKANLVQPFWQAVQQAFDYRSPAPTLHDFAITLFRSANVIEVRKPNAPALLNPHAKVFLQRWKDNNTHGPAFKAWSHYLATALRINDVLDDLNDVRLLASSDLFESFDKRILHWLCDVFMQTTSQRSNQDQEWLTLIQNRRSSIWFEQHQAGYEALANAIELRQCLYNSEIRIEDIDHGLKCYRERWYRIDSAYRKFCQHQRQYGPVTLLQPIVDWVEKTYINQYLLPLADAWGDHVRRLGTWQSDKLPAQTTFFEKFVRPFPKKGQKVYVIISDALRFEAAAELKTKLESENRFNCSLNGMLAALPSYTQLGMAALLPGEMRVLDSADGNVWVDGRSSQGTAARKSIMAQQTEFRMTAITAEELNEMRPKHELRDLMREHDVVYIYHNVIDKIGDTLSTEAKTAEAVAQAFEALQVMVRKIYSANGYNILITADHGFLFQQSDLNTADDLALPRSDEWLINKRRYAIGYGIVPNLTVKCFEAAQLGLAGRWQAAFPVGLGRFPLQGSGKRYVHGGLSLQEVVLPVLHINIVRTNDTAPVEVSLMSAPSKITTGQITLGLYQEQAVAGKILARTLQLGVFAPNGSSLSEVRTLIFDSADPEPRQREQRIGLTMSPVADQYNNQEVEIRLEEKLTGSQQMSIYKRHKVKLQKPFASDFE